MLRLRGGFAARSIHCAQHDEDGYGCVLRQRGTSTETSVRLRPLARDLVCAPTPDLRPGLVCSGPAELVLCRCARSCLELRRDGWWTLRVRSAAGFNRVTSFGLGVKKVKGFPERAKWRAFSTSGARAQKCSKAIDKRPVVRDGMTPFEIRVKLSTEPRSLPAFLDTPWLRLYS